VDTTPRSGNEGLDRQDNAPGWITILGVLAVVLGLLWVLVSVVGWGGPL
jgi:hypothetical protein